MWMNVKLEITAALSTVPAKTALVLSHADVIWGMLAMGLLAVVSADVIWGMLAMGLLAVVSAGVSL